jgi:dynactin 1
MGSISTIVPHSQSNIKKEVENKMDKNNDEDVRSIIRSLALETRMLVKDIRATNATPKVVELSLNSRGPKWNRSCKLPDYQYQTQQSVLYTLNRRCEQLKQKMSYIQNHHVELTPVTPFEVNKQIHTAP